MWKKEKAINNGCVGKSRIVLEFGEMVSVR